MNLPLPQFLPSALPADAEIRKALCMFESTIPCYEKGFKTSLAFEPGTKDEFPRLLSTWLLSVLQRTRLLAWGIIQSVNASNESTVTLAARAMLENMAYLCYMRDNLQRYYAQEITRTDMTWVAFRIRFGRRHDEGWEDWTECEKDLTNAVNVLTALKHVDKYALAAYPQTRPDLFSNWYLRLCEFCHPNILAIEAGTKQNFSANKYAYQLEPVINEGTLGVIAETLVFTQYHFFTLYNECWAMMIENGEKLPQMTPNSDPRIVIE